MEESIDKVPPESNRPLKSAGVIFQFYLLVINLSDIRFLFYSEHKLQTRITGDEIKIKKNDFNV